MRATGSSEREQDGWREILAADGRPNVIAGDRMKPGASQHADRRLGRKHARSGPPQGPDLRAVPAADGEPASGSSCDCAAGLNQQIRHKIREPIPLGC
jgi:hypothetical protein